MNKKELIAIIIEYLEVASYYADKFKTQYDNRESFENEKYKCLVHGIGININDNCRGIEIDFDYFKYDGKEIKHFDPWKLNDYTLKKYDKEFSKDMISYLEDKSRIKKYFTSPYYFII